MSGDLQPDNPLKAGLTSNPCHIAQHLAQLRSELIQVWRIHILPENLLQGLNYLSAVFW